MEASPPGARPRHLRLNRQRFNNEWSGAMADTLSLQTGGRVARIYNILGHGVALPRVATPTRWMALIVALLRIATPTRRMALLAALPRLAPSARWMALYAALPRVAPSTRR